ncbi:hypothetical protein D3C86_1631270 [compost metagenome]
MILEPAFGDLELTGRIAAANQSVETRQMTAVVAFERRTQDFLGFSLGAQLSQLFGIGQHQLRLLSLCRRQLLPSAIE